MNSTGGHKMMIGSVLIIIAIASRLLPHWHNFTAVGATGLFGAFYFRRQIWALLIPILAMWISDLVLNNWIYAAYNPEFVWLTPYMTYVYLGIIALVITGQLVFAKLTGGRLLTASILGSLLFFLISNFGSFLVDPIYPKDSAGLLGAYIAGIPFFWNTLLSNIVYSLMLFGLYQWVSSRFPTIKVASA